MQPRQIIEWTSSLLSNRILSMESSTYPIKTDSPCQEPQKHTPEILPVYNMDVWSAAHRSTTFATWTAAMHHRPLQTALSHLLTKSSCSSPLPSNSPFRRTKSMNWQPLTICTTKPSNLDFILYGHSDLCATRQIAMNLLNSHIASSTPLPTSLPNGQIQSHSNLLTTWVVSPMTSIPGSILL